ncbi:MAG: molybdopterin-dependent oxidoreductase [Gammaproteobacteria bacterium]|nr:molybdopterin-dependent oxidoreductase [Gammaproteobacteria bacterium]
MASSETRKVRTMCPMNCAPTLCGMSVSVENDTLIDIKGDKENPDSQGFLCVRGQAAKEIIGNPQRILHPMVRDSRDSNDWREVSWDEALTKIVDGMQAVKPDEIGLWPGHGSIANDYGTFAHAQLALRFGAMYGTQLWDPSMICWGLGGFGLGLTGIMETNTKEDMGENSDLIILWGANIASQPNTSRHLSAARSRGARIVVIDVRKSEACKLADDYFIVEPGSDSAIALAMMQVIVNADKHDKAFIAEHTVGFEKMAEHLGSHSPEWAASISGIDAQRIIDLANDYADTEKAMIMLGGSSLYKDQNGWQSSRAISCLPGLTGKIGKAGCGIGTRHAGNAHGFQLNHIVDPGMMPPGDYIPNQMSAIIEGFENNKVKVMLLFGTNFLSSFADTNRVAKGLAQTSLIVHHDLFMNETARRYADVVLPATAWLEDVGCKATATHLYLMDQALPAEGECRSMSSVFRALAERLGIDDFYPWQHEQGHIDAVLDHPCTEHASVEKLREEGGVRALNISHIAHPDHKYPTPSGKIEFYSELAEQAGVSPLPVFMEKPASDFPLEMRTGRQLTNFHAFYDHGRALPSLAKLEAGPVLWLSQSDADSRSLTDGANIRIHNQRGECKGVAKISDELPTGVVWLHDGWADLNNLTMGEKSLPDSAIGLFPFSVGQSAFDARVEVSSV